MGRGSTGAVAKETFIGWVTWCILVKLRAELVVILEIVWGQMDPADSVHCDGDTGTGLGCERGVSLL